MGHHRARGSGAAVPYGGAPPAARPPADQAAASRTGVRSSVRTVMRRLLPILVLMYVVGFLDRVNLAFAETGLNRDIGLSATAFGLASGIFFIGYVAFAVPSNLIMFRIGSRIWFARTTLAWGVLAMATALVWDSVSLVIVRFALGFAEAGFYPGLIYYLTRWVPEGSRARALAVIGTGVSITAIIGTPLSGLLLELDGLAGIAGWRWMFLLEGLPAVALSVWLYRRLPEHPGQASWLRPAAAAALRETIAAEQRARQAVLPVRQGLTSPHILAMGSAYFFLNFAGYGALYWVPDLIRRIADLPTLSLSLLTTLPFVLGAAGMLLFGGVVDRSRDRRRPLIAVTCCGAAGLAAAAATPPQWGVAAMAALCVAAFGMLSAFAYFWVLPTGLLSGRTAAAGIALVHCVGVTGGIFSPPLVGAFKDATGDFRQALLVLAAAMLAAAAMLPLVPAPWSRPAAPAGRRAFQVRTGPPG